MNNSIAIGIADFACPPPSPPPSSSSPLSVFESGGSVDNFGGVVSTNNNASPWYKKRFVYFLGLSILVLFLVTIFSSISRPLAVAYSESTVSASMYRNDSVCPGFPNILRKGWTAFGPGYCLDSHDRVYNSTIYSPADPSACPRLCACVAGQKGVSLVGMELNKNFSFNLSSLSSLSDSLVVDVHHKGLIQTSASATEIEVEAISSSGSPQPACNCVVNNITYHQLYYASIACVQPGMDSYIDYGNEGTGPVDGTNNTDTVCCYTNQGTNTKSSKSENSGSQSVASGTSR